MIFFAPPAGCSPATLEPGLYLSLPVQINSEFESTRGAGAAFKYFNFRARQEAGRWWRCQHSSSLDEILILFLPFAGQVSIEPPLKGPRKELGGDLAA